MPTFINQILWEIGKRFRVVSSSFFGTIGSKYAQGISANLQLIQVRQHLFCVWIKVEHLATQTDLIVDSFFNFQIRISIPVGSFDYMSTVRALEKV